MSPRLTRKLHRWLGLLFSLSILMSSGSGVTHVIMPRTQSPPPAAKPSGALLDAATITVPPSVALAGRPIAAANLRNIGGIPYYQCFVVGQQNLLYLNAQSGAETPGADAKYAREIARDFLNSDELTQTNYLTAFDSEYIGIFRILPVYRFDLADGKGTRVYVSTMTGSVTRHTDDGKQFEASVFTNFHKLGFIPNKDARDWTLTLLTSATFVVALLGIALFFMTRPKKRAVT